MKTIVPEFRSSSLSPWPHRLAVALALVTFPLIWVGGLVTTYNAGMAVPDWPGTFGYNLFAYPWQTWIAGPWDLFIEHGHRLLGATAGLVAIALVAAACLVDRRRWLIEAAWGALALVILQGVLGGARVLFDERLIALIHGCIGPLFFAYLAGLVVVTSRWWQTATHVESAVGSRLARAAWATVGIAFVQLVLGAIVRHVPLTASPGVFRAALVLHLVVAALLAFHVLARPWLVWKYSAGVKGVAWPIVAVQALVVAQIALGVGTYVMKYSWPAWLGDFQFAAAYRVQADSLGQAMMVTAHVANGSLILFLAVLAAMRTTRVFSVKFAGGRMPASLGRAAG